MHQSIGRSSFKVVYGFQSIGQLDLVPYVTNKQFSGYAKIRTKQIKKLHEEGGWKLRNKMRCT